MIIIKKVNLIPNIYMVFLFRHRKSLPILNEYENWHNTNSIACHIQFAITKAINYSLNGMKELRN